MNYCTRCGNKLDKNDKFCKKCGNRVEELNNNEKGIDLKKPQNNVNPKKDIIYDQNIVNNNEIKSEDSNINNYKNNDQNTTKDLNKKKSKLGKIILYILIGIILTSILGVGGYYASRIIADKFLSNSDENLKMKTDIMDETKSSQNESKSVEKDEKLKAEEKAEKLEEKDDDLIDQSILNEKIKSEVANLDNSTSANYTVAFMDLKSKDFMSYNSRKVNSASVIKIFIMIEAYKQIEAGVLNENEDIVLRDYMKVGGSGILAREEDGTSQKIVNLIDLMMTQSDNTAANMLIDKLGMDNINKTIGVLGMNDTVLSRKMMDENAINNGIQNYTSVNDLCKVLKMLYNGECVNKEYDSKMLDIMKRHQNSTKIPNPLPDNVLVSHKSGEFTGVENDAGIVFTDKGDYILCILSDNGNSGEQISNINKISKMVYDEFLKTK